MKRKKLMVAMTLDPAVVERLKAWIAQQEIPVAFNATVSRAIMAYIDDKEAQAAKQTEGAAS